MKSVWSGAIEFGLVNIPIKLYSATEPRTVSFKLLCKKCHTPIKYQRYCPKCKKEVSWEDVIYGIKIGRTYKTFTREELAKMKPTRSDTAEVVEFTAMSEIDPIYFQKNYYVTPAKEKEKAFFLFMEALRSSAKVAIVKITMRNKEYMAMIRPYKKLLLLTTLLYQSEVRSPETLESQGIKTSPTELKLAGQVIKKYSRDEFDIGKYHDEFAEKIKEIILGKAPRPKKEKPKPEKLLEALKLSAK